MADAVLLPLQITVDPATVQGSVSLPLEVTVSAPASLVLPLGVTVYDPAGFPGHNGIPSGSTFSVYVEVGGNDLTDRLIGTVDIDAEEGAARVASFTVILETGAFEPDQWINLPVVVDYLQGGQAFRVFTGIVDLPELSLEDNRVTFSCTDNLQDRFEGRGRESIEQQFANTGARWSQAVFGEYEDSAQFADDLLSTLSASADLDRNGLLVFGQWYAAGYDFLFADAEVFPESIAVEWGSRRDIITQVDISVEYTYQFFRERNQRYSWEYPRSFGQYLEENSSLPTSDMIERAASADGWRLLGKVAYERLPESGEYSLPSGGTTNWSISDEVRLQLATAADFTIRKRWIQDVRESYSVTVRSPANQARFGELKDELAVTLDTSIDETGFDEFESEPMLQAEAIGSDTAWSSFSLAERDGALETAVARAGVIIQESMRENTVAFKTLIQPELERFHFVRLSSLKVTAQGKVRRVRHQIDLDAGSALTDVELAIFRGEAAAGGTLSYNGLDYSETGEGRFTALNTVLQNFEGNVPEPGPAYQGYVGNYVSQLNNVPNPFEERFAILTPEITEQSRDPVEYSESLTVQAETFNQDMLVNL